MDDGSLLGGQWGHTHDINHHHFLGGSDIPWMSDDLEDVISRTCWSEHHFSMSSSRSKSGGRVLTFFWLEVSFWMLLRTKHPSSQIREQGFRARAFLRLCFCLLKLLLHPSHGHAHYARPNVQRDSCTCRPCANGCMTDSSDESRALSLYFVTLKHQSQPPLHSDAGLVEMTSATESLWA